MSAAVERAMKIPNGWMGGSLSFWTGRRMSMSHSLSFKSKRYGCENRSTLSLTFLVNTLIVTNTSYFFHPFPCTANLYLYADYIIVCISSTCLANRSCTWFQHFVVKTIPTPTHLALVHKTSQSQYFPNASKSFHTVISNKSRFQTSLYRWR